MSLWPFRETKEKLFGEGTPDLYGPTWILATLVVSTTILGSLVNDTLASGENSADRQLGKFARSLTIFPSYLFLVPLVIWGVLRKFGASDLSYWHTVSLFGYSLSAFLILELAYLIPLFLFQVLATLAALAISMFLVKRELEVIVREKLPKRELKLLVYFGAGCGILLAMLLKFYFFSGH